MATASSIGPLHHPERPRSCSRCDRTQAPADWVALALLVMVAVDLILLPGQKTFNRYGAPPKAQSGGSPD